MATIFEQVQEQFLAEIAHHRDLLALAEEKTTALVANDLAGLTALAVREKAAEVKGREWKRRRDALLAAGATVLQVPLAKVRILALITRAEPELRDKLMRLLAELKTVLADLGRRQERNQRLARCHLSFVHDLMDVIAGAEDRVAYDRCGRSPERAHRQGALIDQRC